MFSRNIRGLLWLKEELNLILLDYVMFMQRMVMCPFVMVPGLALILRLLYIRLAGVVFLGTLMSGPLTAFIAGVGVRLGERLTLVCCVAGISDYTHLVECLLFLSCALDVDC